MLRNCSKKFSKYSLKLKNSTSTTALLYGETGYPSIETKLKIKTITFWVNLITGRRDKFSYKLYLICLALYRRGLIIFKWLDHMINILNETGFTYVFTGQ